VRDIISLTVHYDDDNDDDDEEEVFSKMTVADFP